MSKRWHQLTLIGDGIENPANALTMVHAASMFGAPCRFHDRHDLKTSWQDRSAPSFSQVAGEELNEYRPHIAFENVSGAADLYGFSLPGGPRPAVTVGNERRGIAPAVLKRADRCVQLPVVSRTINCLNVAAAAATALYYLSRGNSGKVRAVSHPEKRRPEIVLLGAADHIELGSTIRSAGALGWRRLLVDDRHKIWFGCDRVTRSEGRGAARRGRNPISLLPLSADRRLSFDEVCVVNSHGIGDPLHRVTLARGQKQVIVIPDESAIDLATEDWQRFGKDVRSVRLDLPKSEFTYRYRLAATIALADIARQVGRRLDKRRVAPKRWAPFYDHSLELIQQKDGETVYLQELSDY